MNHQSLLDIPTAVLMAEPYVPRFVARARYARWVPAVSLSMRLLGCPIVEPENRKASLRALREAARDQPHGLLVFPEGHRTRDGEIQAFHTAGLEIMLRERPLPGVRVVTDGFWKGRRFVDFLFNIDRIDGRTEVLGPFAAARRRTTTRRSCRGCATRWSSTCGSCAEARVWPPEALRAAVGRARAPGGAASRRGRGGARGGRGRRRGRALPSSSSAPARRKARPDAYSAYDLFVVVSAYTPFYRSLRDQGRLRHPPALVAALNAWLPPNQVSVRVMLADGPRVLAKCAVISETALQRETSPMRHDHFWPAGSSSRRSSSTPRGPAAEDAVARRARLRARPHLRLGAAVAARALRRRRLLPDAAARLLAGEIRPEPEGRAEALWRAQEDYLRPVYSVLLEALQARGDLVTPEPGVLRPGPSGLRRRARAQPALLPVVAGARHGALGQVRRDLRGLARVHRSARPSATAGSPSS